MAVVITLSALILLMVVAYRGYSVIVFAPVAAHLANGVPLERIGRFWLQRVNGVR
jgi:H+/gluconate symporter-like permease